jgi:predicted ATPase
VLVLGEAGIGKSRLAAELAITADRGGGLVLLGHCDEEAIVAYQPVVEAATTLVERLPAEFVARAVRDVGGELVRLLPGLGRYAEPLPSETTAPPDVLRYRLFEAVAGLFAAASEDVPLLLALEDLHWADAPPLLLIKHLVRRADRSRLLVLGTVRGTRLGGRLLTFADDLRREHGADVMPLHGLDVVDIVAMIEATPGPCVTLDPGEGRRLATRIHRETSGNSFFVAELLRHVAPAATVGASASTIAVPETVRDAIVRRVEGLSALSRHVLSIAAVAGRRFRVDLVARVAELSADRIVSPLEEAQAHGFSMRRPTDPDG